VFSLPGKKKRVNIRHTNTRTQKRRERKKGTALRRGEGIVPFSEKNPNQKPQKKPLGEGKRGRGGSSYL